VNRRRPAARPRRGPQARPSSAEGGGASVHGVPRRLVDSDRFWGRPGIGLWRRHGVGWGGGHGQRRSGGRRPGHRRGGGDRRRGRRGLAPPRRPRDPRVPRSRGRVGAFDPRPGFGQLGHSTRCALVAEEHRSRERLRSKGPRRPRRGHRDVPEDAADGDWSPPRSAAPGPSTAVTTARCPADRAGPHASTTPGRKLPARTAPEAVGRPAVELLGEPTCWIAAPQRTCGSDQASRNPHDGRGD